MILLHFLCEPMYEDIQRNRILLRDGTSLVSSFEYAKRLYDDKAEDRIRAVDDFHSRTYNFINNVDIIFRDDNFVEPSPQERDQVDKNELLEIIKDFPRYEESFEDRLKTEVDFFDRTGRLNFIVDLIVLIDQFKNENVIWGVGRGSSCASITMYIIEVNDVNPLEYDIPFSEMSKEEEY